MVGTPGRVIDHTERGNLRLGDLRFLVLDEADQMLDIGFKEDIERILSTVVGAAASGGQASTTKPLPFTRSMIMRRVRIL